MPLTCPGCNNLISETDAICPVCGQPLTAQDPAPSAQAIPRDADFTLVANRNTSTPAGSDSTLVRDRNHSAPVDMDSTLFAHGKASVPADADSTLVKDRQSAPIDTDSTLLTVDRHVAPPDADITRIAEPQPLPPNSPASAAGAPGQGNHSFTGLRVGESFMGCVLEERIASSGSEADIFRVRQDEGEYVLKLYHYNTAPKKEILDKMRGISGQFPECVVRIYECGQDTASGRWYELQEYVRNGSLKDLMPGLSQSLSTNPGAALTLVGPVVREIAEALAVLHARGVMHCDLKPANILVRALEPLDLVLTDFGISSMLDPEASSRATSIKGSPMYQAPEAFTGHVTRSVDWWALGCILCEILLSRHPFSGLNPHEIMLKLVQKGVDLTGLDFSQPPLKDFELPLKGLLTGDYQKRWGWEEVRRWLGGERNIPVHYLNARQTEDLTPYRAGDREYYELRELLASFTENEEAWKRGREALYRGELEIWLASNRREEDRKKVTEVKNRCIDHKDWQDAGLFELIYAYNPQLAFCFCGTKISAASLRLLCGKQVRKERLTQAEAGVAKAISNGTLLLLVAQIGNNEIESILDLLKNARTPERQWICLAAVFTAPVEYYWPPFAGDLINSQPQDRLDFLRRRPIPLVCPLSELRNRALTPELAIKMQNPVSYDEFLTEMEHLLSRPDTGQTDDAQPMAFSNCDGSQFTVRIAQNRTSPPLPPKNRPRPKKNSNLPPSPPSPQNQPRPTEDTEGYFSDLPGNCPKCGCQTRARICPKCGHDVASSVKGDLASVFSKVACLISDHTWLGCKCTRCGETRDAEHTFKPIEGKCEQKCSVCGKTEDFPHQWVGDKCARCGLTKGSFDKIWKFFGEFLSNIF